MKYALPLFLATATLANAQGIPEDWALYRYDGVSLTTPDFFSEAFEVEIRLGPVDDDVRTVVECDRDWCSETIVASLVMTRESIWGNREQLSDPEHRESSKLIVTSDGFELGDLFPLTDGAAFVWVEHWAGTDWAETYDLSATVSCCVEPSTSAGPSEQVWEISMVWEARTVEGGSGTIDYLYDEQFGWWVERTLRTINPLEGELPTILTRTERLISIE